jgi:hypothetical protein
VWILIGTVVGGALAIAGSVFVARYELTRRHRVNIHLRLLPALLSALRSQRLAPAIELADEIEREAAVASRRDRMHAHTIRERTQAALGAKANVRPGSAKLVETEEGHAFETALGDAVDAAESYGKWLEDSFSLIDRARGRRRPTAERRKRARPASASPPPDPGRPAGDTSVE